MLFMRQKALSCAVTLQHCRRKDVTACFGVCSLQGSARPHALNMPMDEGSLRVTMSHRLVTLT